MRSRLALSCLSKIAAFVRFEEVAGWLSWTVQAVTCKDAVQPGLLRATRVGAAVTIVSPPDWQHAYTQPADTIAPLQQLTVIGACEFSLLVLSLHACAAKATTTVGINTSALSLRCAYSLFVQCDRG